MGTNFVKGKFKVKKDFSIGPSHMITKGCIFDYVAKHNKHYITSTDVCYNCYSFKNKEGYNYLLNIKIEDLTGKNHHLHNNIVNNNIEILTCEIILGGKKVKNPYLIYNLDLNSDEFILF